MTADDGERLRHTLAEQRDNRANLTAVDLFSGCGGMSLGFQNAGFRLLGAYDNWQPAVDVYAANFNSPVRQRNLADESAVSEIAALMPFAIIGGPPCQDFSQAGRRTEDGGRALLTVRYGEIIAQCMPQIIVMENVPRVRTSMAFRRIKGILKDKGYGLTERVLDASRCGVPQARKRFFMIGCLSAEDGFLDEILDERMAARQMTIRDYFGDSLGIDYYFRIPRSYDRRAIFSIDEPAMTVRGVDRPIPPNYKLHPNDAAPLSKARCLTPKERSLIQTFPEDFEFFGTKTDVNQMIGNAVPVKMAEFVARAVLSYLEDGNDALC